MATLASLMRKQPATAPVPAPASKSTPMKPEKGASKPMGKRKPSTFGRMGKGGW